MSTLAIFLIHEVMKLENESTCNEHDGNGTLKSLKLACRNGSL